jgi:hypothetical protein
MHRPCIELGKIVEGVEVAATDARDQSCLLGPRLTIDRRRHRHLVTRPAA